jgi:DNA-binding NarL/FixJ family response regulator
VKVLLIDDHGLFREGMRLLLCGLDSRIDLDEAEDCERALELAAGGRYDLALLDLRLPGLDGLDALAAVREAMPGVPVVVLSGEDDPGTIRAAIDHGAMGFIPKSSTPEVLVRAMRTVLQQGVFLPSAALDRSTPAAAAASAVPEAPESGSSVEGLTARQMDVLRCVIQGKPNKVIAKNLDIAEATVKVHVSAVLRALGAHNRTEAVYAAAKLGLKLV